MKKMYLLAVLMAAAMPFTSMAQDDDLYFNPKKEAKEKAERKAALLREYKAQQARRDSIYALFWSGSNRNVDEYNRGGRFLSHYEKVGTDSLGNDIIQFHVGKGVAPDSIYDDAYFAQKYINEEEDFGNTRRMSRWDGYYDPWFYGSMAMVHTIGAPACGGGTILGDTATIRAGTTHGLILGMIHGIMAMPAGMAAGTTHGIMAGVAGMALGTGVVR